MKIGILAALAVTIACRAETNAVPGGTTVEASALAFDAGADLRVRQEIMHNVPGLPGAPGADQTPSDENGGGETVESEEKSNQGA